jgi:hypothetical protein
MFGTCVERKRNVLVPVLAERGPQESLRRNCIELVLYV